MLVLKVISPVWEVGFFGLMCKGLYALTGNKRMRVYHWDLGQRVCIISGGAGGVGLRRLLSNAVRLLVTSLPGRGGGNGVGGASATLGDGMIVDENFGGNNSIKYLVGCTQTAIPSLSSPSSSSSSLSPHSPALHLLAGNSEGDGYLFQVNVDCITPLAHLGGGHRGCIHDFGWERRRGKSRRNLSYGEEEIWLPLLNDVFQGMHG